MCECAEGPVVTTVKWYSPTVALTHLKPQHFAAMPLRSSEIQRTSNSQIIMAWWIQRVRYCKEQRSNLRT